MPNDRTGHVSWTPWEFDYAVSDSEGLSVLNGSFLGVPVFGKLSLPVIRVKYAVDEGGIAIDPHSSGPFAIAFGAGPFADQIKWNLGGDHGLQRISNRKNEYVGYAEMNINNVYWFEISVYARIGAYHLNQCWFFSHLGSILPRIWSKGLHTNIDHTHHAYWRFDFDIDGPANNTVFVKDGNNWFHYPRECNDIKSHYANPQWLVWNQQTHNGAWVIPGPNDGSPDAFSGIDVGVRLYHPSEEANPWPFGTGGLGFHEGEPTLEKDVVLWYVAHLFHRADEGADHWHGAGPTITLKLGGNR